MVQVAHLETQSHVTGHISQEEGHEIAEQVACAVKIIKTRIVFIGSHHREIRRKRATSKPVVVITESFHKQSRTDHTRLQIAKGRICVDGFEVIGFVTVSHRVGRGQKGFGEKGKVGYTILLHVVLHGPERVIEITGILGNPRWAELHMGHVAPHEVEIVGTLASQIPLTEVVPGR